MLLGAAACASLPLAGTPAYQTVTQQPGDKVTFGGTAEDVTIEITSEKGIGSAEIERLGPAPKTLTVNYHLKGLEETTAGWAGVRVAAHVASRDGSVSEEVGLGGSPAQPIASTSPYWMPVRIASQDPKIPLEDGYFAVTASPAFIEAAPQRFVLKWIDFYR